MQFRFYEFMDYCEEGENGKMARVATMGENEVPIPINIFVDNYEDVKDFHSEFCEIEVCGTEGKLDIFQNEEEYLYKENSMAPISLIPMGTFSPKEDDENFTQSPYILFSGKVLDIEKNETADEMCPNYCLYIETFELKFSLYVRYDEIIEPGYYVHGTAWLFGDMVPDVQNG